MRDVMILAVLLSAASVSLAQTPQEPAQTELKTIDEYLELVRGEIRKRRRELVIESMELSDELSARFEPIYDQYEAEAVKLGDVRVALLMELMLNFDQLNEQQARQLAEQALSLQEQRIALKRKYFEKVADAMSAVIAARFLQVDNQIDLLIDLKVATEMPLIES